MCYKLASYFVEDEGISDGFSFLQRLDLRGHKIRSLDAVGSNLSPTLEVFTISNSLVMIRLLAFH